MEVTLYLAVILAYRRTKKFYYVYYVLRTLTGMICDGGIQCVALAYVVNLFFSQQYILFIHNKHI